MSNDQTLLPTNNDVDPISGTYGQIEEAAALRRADVDCRNGLLIVQQGKDKLRRIAALIGNCGLKRLQEWRGAQSRNRQYVFCRVRKGNVPGPDKPL
jgi:integrase